MGNNNLTEEVRARIFELHLKGVKSDAIKQRTGVSVGTICEIIRVRRFESGMEPVTAPKPGGWKAPTPDLSKSRHLKARAK